jgi:hypothetical protein
VSSAVGPAAAFALIRQRTFGPYFVGNALSASGTWFQNLAAALLIYRQTHSALLLGVLNFSQFLPILLLAPWAGGASDRFNRRQLLLVTQSVAIVLSGGLGLLAWHHLAPPAVMIADAVALGIVSAFSAPAQRAMMPQLVEPHAGHESAGRRDLDTIGEDGDTGGIHALVVAMHQGVHRRLVERTARVLRRVGQVLVGLVEHERRLDVQEIEQARNLTEERAGELVALGMWL